ncbi:saccharopine dehydrogenase family protein [Halorientalis brevis]|uniref:Saccharopine dehydrogenase family protein n=1 Tax=Halorientalis brevis TaxID=1126241 RepID=A0ABD6CB00_9EURY|nr:saccharopine dehydrogenase NADP-binding domain-containing protein [Halorientalis brevis]
MADLLIYGSYGYTGELIAEAAVERGITPILAGRSERKLARQADELDCPTRPLDLAADDVPAALADVDVVLNCAGPFVDTYEPLVEACIESSTHYLDITGEIDVFQGVAAHDEAARDAGVMLMSGVGFDVVPTDCLAAHLADRLPDATHLALGFEALSSVSAGTAKTAIEFVGDGGVVRRDGLLEPVAPAHKTRRIDFGRGERTAATIPWGDLVTAAHTTGIPNVEVYAAMPEPIIWSMRGTRLFAPLLGCGPVKSTLQELVDATVDGPSERQREGGRSYLWGEATNDDGDRVVSRLETPETYALTVETALATATRALDGDAPAGYQTPAGAYGADLILDVEATAREDVE